MKPPPRTRAKPRPRTELGPQRPGKRTSKWLRAEQKKLLNGLQRLKTKGAGRDIDCAYLRRFVTTRSISEIQSVVELLKNRVITTASNILQKKKLEEKKVKKPIEEWAEMASALAGNLEETISSAFCQMLIVSSTEPRTLRNCDPPQVHRPPSDSKPIGRTVPLRPMPRQPFKVPHPPPSGEHPASNTSRPLGLLKTPAPSMGPARRLQTKSQVVRVPNGKQQQQPSPKAGNPPAAASTSQSQPAEQCTTTSRPSTSSSSPTPLSSPANNCTRVLSTASSAVTQTPPLSTAASVLHSKFGRTSKFATKDSPRTLGVKCVVDFERIYRFLSVVDKPEEECQLTPMESAIVLDLLMCLPEQLPQLNCNKLRKHMIEMHQCLSSPVDSKKVKEMFPNLNDGLSSQTEAQSSSDLNRTNSNQNTAVTADSADVSEGGKEKLQQRETESQASGSNNTSEDANMMGLCPPLNPFMVPLKLLMNR
ncbi:snRNA-activating protein complex subunit 2 [Stegastes partitus]|uniref:snRNA-activating protein complex subunit 2 n=1 Tax=Stegastes partitus TaxID=144197 RepID=A0A9Y4NQL2_9TELE|nr:PREDICTED: snRNA-activating protein complex subunit 2 [Stegastes partitus]